MDKRILLVVGDKFESYVAQKEAITVSELLNLLRMPKTLADSQELKVLIPGQGIGDKSCQALLQAAASSENVLNFDFSLWHALPVRASIKLAHKANTSNVLVSVPRQVSSDQFELELMIDEDCEMMNDHMSGQHMQGMVIMEAARQAMIAVTEMYLLPEKDTDYSFISDSLTVSYSNYAFPVNAIIRTTITESATDSHKTLKFLAKTTVEQCGHSVAEFIMGYSAIEKERSIKQERIQSVRTHRQFLAGVADTMNKSDSTVGRVG